MKYTVRLDLFEGPLDLLLFLIRKDEIDIYDIPMAEITQQYMDYITTMKELDIELAADYFVMASDLLKIKSELLLPRQKTAEGEEYDPRTVLVGQLLEYQRFKEASEKLHELADVRADEFNRVISNISGETSVDHLEITMDTYDLLVAFQDVLRRYRHLQPAEMEKESINVGERANEIEQLLIKNQREMQLVQIVEFFLEIKGLFKMELIVTLLAILELVKRGSVRARQQELFSPIWIKLA
jgi:segregation and condensation protein A